MGGRTITSALQTEFDETVTSVFYLIQITGTQILRWSNGHGDDITFQGVPWIDMDFDITGLSFDPDKDPECGIKVNNMDGAVAAFLRTEPIAECIIDIYQMARGATADDDIPMLVRMVFGDCEIGPDFLSGSLLGYASRYAFSPRRRVDPYNGFNFALPRGTKIVWGTETFILEPIDNG